MLSAVKGLYGITCQLVDLRSANVSSLFATYERVPEVRTGVATSVSRWRRGCRRLQHAACSWMIAFEYYHCTVGRTHAETLRDARRRRTDVNEYRVLKNALTMAEAPRWKEYLEARVSANGWDAACLTRALRHLPRSMPQGYRWFLLKFHLNAPLTTARAAAAGRASVVACPFCNQPGGGDWCHILSCPMVMATRDRLFAAGRIPPLALARPALMLQHDMDGASVAAVIATFASIRRLRAACVRTSLVLT